MGDLHLHGRASQSHALVAPVELVGLTGGKGERHEHALSRGGPLCEELLSIAAHRIVAAGIAFLSQPFEQAHVAQPLPLGLGQLLGEQGVEAREMAVELRSRLMLALVGESGLVRA